METKKAFTAGKPALVKKSLLLLALVLLFNAVTFAQTTAFTYQGRLTDGGTAANGNYDLQFKLFDSLSGGTQVGSAQILSAVSVSAGIFTVTLDFATSFPGADRFLEISARQAGSASFTLLTPRQQITSTPYAVRSLNASSADTATQLGGVAASQFVQTNDARLTDARSPTAGSSNYIQNSSSPQAANFNISGNGKVGASISVHGVSSDTDYDINGGRVLSIKGTNNTFVGLAAGEANTTGANNTFVGLAAGFSNTTGGANTFVGAQAGQTNVQGNYNSFFGDLAGFQNTGDPNNPTLGSGNSFFGDTAGTANTTGDSNSFFGLYAGGANTTANSNSFFGAFAGDQNGTGIRNSFFGYNAGHTNKTGVSNTVIGRKADLGSDNLANATAIGANALVTQDNSLVLGSISGVNQAAADTNVGIGTTAPTERLTIKTAASKYGFIHTDGTITVGSFLGGSTGGGWYGTKSNHPLSFFVNNGAPSLTIDTAGLVSITTLGAAGSTQLCRNASNQISTCSSSLRYKTRVTSFVGGLDIVQRLRPIAFTWKQDGVKDIGFGAEEVEKVAPMFTFKNDKGEIEGVRYDRLGVVFVNAFKEQQAQIEQQQAQLEQQQEQLGKQQNEIAALKKLVCRSHRRASVCK